GGLSGTNSGTIAEATASGAVTSNGANSTVGGLVGANVGTIADSTASGAVTSTGANSTVGALVGTNTGTITNSTGSGVVINTGGSTGGGSTGGGSTSGGSSSTANLPSSQSIVPGNTGILSQTTATLPAAPFFESLPGPVQVINNLVGQGPS